MSDELFSVHVIEQSTGKKLAAPLLIGLPRVGDELRLASDKYVMVRRVIWCMDEPYREGQRVNLGVDRIE